MVDQVRQIFYEVMRRKLTRAKPNTDAVEISERLRGTEVTVRFARVA